MYSMKINNMKTTIQANPDIIILDITIFPVKLSYPARPRRITVLVNCLPWFVVVRLFKQYAFSTFLIS